MTDYYDPIVDEIHKTRERLLAEFDGDLDALVKDAQRRTEESRQAGRTVVSYPPRRPKGWIDPTKKAC